VRNILVAAVVAIVLPTAVLAESIVVFAASSLKNALDPAMAEWSARTGNVAAISYGSSATLAKQIEQGAPADVFLSAAQNWMDELETSGQVAAGTRVDLWGNGLSVIAHDPMAIPFAMDQSTDLAGIVGDQKLAMGLVASVPVGQYGKEALVRLGQWERVKAQVVQTEDARATLGLVASGEAAYGIVYTTDAVAAEAAGQAIEVSRFPEDSHKPIVYPGALVAGSTKPEAADLLAFLHSGPARDIFAAQGFVILAK
jgi:molybdate transport system substrate-binding protein